VNLNFLNLFLMIIK